MEREMRDYLYDNGHMALRMPASGAAPDYDLPDLLASINGIPVAIELKATSGNAVRFDIGEDEDEEDDIHQLIRFGNEWPAMPVLAARYPYDKNSYYISDPYDWLDHQYGSFQLKKSERDEMPKIDELFSLADDDILSKDDMRLSHHLTL